MDNLNIKQELKIPSIVGDDVNGLCESGGKWCWQYFVCCKFFPGSTNILDTTQFYHMFCKLNFHRGRTFATLPSEPTALPFPLFRVGCDDFITIFSDWDCQNVFVAFI